MFPGATVQAWTGWNVQCRQDQLKDLISTNVDMLESLLRDVAATRKPGTVVGHLGSKSDATRSDPYDEIQLVIEMKQEGLDSNDFRPTADLPPIVRAELRDFVVAIAARYQSNGFHNFQHASHVAHISNLLVQSMKGGEGEKQKDESDIAFDPLARFAIVLSALAHDVGHTGVPNCRLAEENPDLALKYGNKSIAEQNAIDISWYILMADCFHNLRHSLFQQSAEERERLRQLLVNCVMATDIFDHDLRALRQSRSEKVHAEVGDLSPVERTSILKIYSAFLDGRAEKDPSEEWYKGELWFFDNWVLPLAQNLKDCGVWNVASDQLLKQATSNRFKWALEGQETCRAMLEKAKQRHKNRVQSVDVVSSESSVAAETFFTSHMVNEIESLSKVMKRYERKTEAACGNLIAVTCKDKSGATELRKQSWSDIREHFRQKDWYRMSHSDDEMSGISIGSGNLQQELLKAEIFINSTA